jgi:xanthine dehydrogenase YagS FAD-binding subunit
VREPDEIVTEVELPPPTPGRRSTYRKVRSRRAIDFPQLSVAAAATFGEDGRIEALDLVVGGLGSKPRRTARAGEIARGRRLDSELAGAVADAVADPAHPLGTVDTDAGWRRQVLRVHARRALLDLAGPGTAIPRY